MADCITYGLPATIVLCCTAPRTSDKEAELQEKVIKMVMMGFEEVCFCAQFLQFVYAFMVGRMCDVTCSACSEICL